MKSYVDRMISKFLYLTLILLTIILSCTKDEGNLENTLLENIETKEIESTTKLTSKEVVTQELTFYPIEDAYLQSGKGYNQNILRLEEDRRTSYILFDLRKIKELKGSLVSLLLKFTVESDGGDGSVSVFNGGSSVWSDSEISGTSAPKLGTKLATAASKFEVGKTKELKLNADLIEAGFLTLVLTHKDGNDFAIASKEHPDGKGPELVVNYNIQADGDSKNKESNSNGETVQSNSTSDLKAIGTPSVTSGKAPLKVTFLGSSSKHKQDIAKWNWKFGDGNNSGNKNPIHTFEKVGNYSVSFEVVDKAGNSAKQNITIQVNSDTLSVSDNDDEGEKDEITDTSGQNNSGGLAAIGTPSKTTGKAPLEVSFLGSSTKDKKDIAKWNWNFSDGGKSGNKNPTHTFAKAGTYNVNFEVVDTNGVSATQIITITVTNEEPSGSEDSGNNDDANISDGLRAFGAASTTFGSAPLNVFFSGSSSVDKSNITKWNWNFGDGNRSGNKNPQYTFTAPGTFNVSLTVIDKSGKSATDNITIQVDRSNNSGSGGGSGYSGGANSASSKPPKTNDYPSNAVFASSFGYNSSNATKAFESALRSGSSYVVIDKQSNDWIIEPTRIFDLSNMTIVFEPGVVLRSKTGSFSSSSAILFELFRAKNVTIEGEGATFKMDKSRYTSGESRHALSIRQGDDIAVRGLTLKDSGGDGIYIAGGNSRNYSRNITIDGVVCTNNRRLGMGIISAENVWVRNSEFLATSGTLPEAGVDLEPNEPSERLVNINFSNCKFSDNDNMGFFLSTGKLNSSSRAISVKVSDSEFNFNAKSPNDNGPRAGINLSQGTTTNPVKGEIVFENILFGGGDHRIIFSKKTAKSYRAVFKDCFARNVTRKGNSPVIDLEALGSATTLGGFVFDNFQLQYNSDVSFMQIKASSNYIVKDIKGDFRIKEPNDNPLRYVGGYNTSRNQNVSIRYNHAN